MLKEVDIYSDGSSRGNPGPGGYGALLRYRDPSGAIHERELSAGFRLTTNNRMELLGVIAALELLREPCDVTIHTDSKYVCDAFNQNWVEGWVRRGWRKADKKPVLNIDLWQRLLSAMEPHRVRYEWVKGHAGIAENERCDELATSAADSDELQEDFGYQE